MAVLVCLKYLHAGRLSEEPSNVPEGNVSESEKTEGKQWGKNVSQTFRTTV